MDVARIQAQLAELEALLPNEPSWWRVGPTWSEDELVAWERAHVALPLDYRRWLAEVGDGGAGFVGYTSAMGTGIRSTWGRHGVMRPLVEHGAEELAAATQTFRARQGQRAVANPMPGALYLGDAGSIGIYLVVRGKRAGQIWKDCTGYDGRFHSTGTFADEVAGWLAQEPPTARKQAMPRHPAELAAIEPDQRFATLCSAPDKWLRHGPQLFVDAFRPVDRAHLTLVDAIARLTTPWLREPALATAAAIALGHALDAHAALATPVIRATGAVFESDPPDTSPERIAAFVAAAGEASPDERSDVQWECKWLVCEMLAADRLDEACAVFRVDRYPEGSAWLHIARRLVAAHRANDAFALHDVVGGRRDAAAVMRARLHAEIGDRDAAVAWLDRAVDRAVDSRDWFASLIATYRKTKTIDVAVAPITQGAVPSGRVHTSGYELVALLYGVAGDGEHMADAAVRALAFPAVRRRPAEQANHFGHLRMGRALAGIAVETTPIELRLYTGRAALAAAILERTGDIGVSVTTI